MWAIEIEEPSELEIVQELPPTRGRSTARHFFAIFASSSATFAVKGFSGGPQQSACRFEIRQTFAHLHHRRWREKTLTERLQIGR